MEKLLSAIETGSVDKVKEIIDNTAVSLTACSEVSFTAYCMYNNMNVWVYNYVCVLCFVFAHTLYGVKLFQIPSRKRYNVVTTMLSLCTLSS